MAEFDFLKLLFDPDYRHNPRIVAMNVHPAGRLVYITSLSA